MTRKVRVPNAGTAMADLPPTIRRDVARLQVGVRWSRRDPRPFTRSFTRSCLLKRGDPGWAEAERVLAWCLMNRKNPPGLRLDGGTVRLNNATEAPYIAVTQTRELYASERRYVLEPAGDE